MASVESLATPGADQQPPSGARVSAVEAKSLSDATERLATRFAELPRALVSDTVVAIHRRFESSRVRDFVPLLVEREARRRLETLHGRGDRHG